MKPASRPMRSCSSPSCGVMLSCVCRANEIGSAPNFSCSASCLAESVVKEPVVEARPSLITARAWGAVMTALSSTTANWSSGGSDCRPKRRLVTAANFALPASLKDRATSTMEVGWPLGPGWKPLDASAISLPSISLGPRTYFVTRSSPQVAMGAAGAATTLSTAPGVEQSRATYCLATFVAASSALALSQPMPTRPLLAWALIAASVSAGVGAGAACGAVGVGVAPADGLVAVLVAVGLGVAVAARSASGTTPFCAVADVEGVAVLLAFGVDFEVAAPVAAPEGVAVPVGVPLGASWLALASSAWT